LKAYGTANNFNTLSVVRRAGTYSSLVETRKGRKCDALQPETVRRAPVVLVLGFKLRGSN